ncbi:hypothetical protein RhiirC2_850628 [Rhizophagus irregularis]|uniref:Kelch-like protein 17 n=1 Tax=Rhizophagus irregularis TaxID=588596 RepID=A0A2N1N6L0_9GLOM|nr:hypothetical protein RhiirC2_850628 [Rhizophagus irregularis]
MDIDLTNILLRDLRKLFENCDDYNIILKVGKGLDMNSFHAHSIILKNRSEYFKNLITDYFNKKGSKFFKKGERGDYINLEIPQISADAFKIILRYIYTGYFSFNDNENNQEFLLDLIFAADELKLNDLVKHLQIFIIETNSNWIRNNLIKIYQLSLKRNFDIIQDHCVKLIEKEPTILFISNNFFLLKESDLIKLLKRDDLELQEIDIWRYLLKWGLEQDPTLIVSNIKKWSNEEFYKLEKRLHKLIPFVRFYSMSATQYYEEVRPFKKILPKKLREDIKAFYILSNNVPPPDALPPRRLFRHETILKRQHQMRDRINQHYTPRHSMIVDIFDRNNITPTPVPPEAPPYTLGKHKNISDHDIKIKYHDFFSIERENSPILNIADFSSVLINKNQAKRIVRWIDEKKNFIVCGERVNNNSHILKLLLRGSRDGMSRETFHYLCDNKGPTVIVAKVEKSKNIIGGYNPNPWTSSNKWIESIESFIFSFKSDGNREGIDDIILSRIKNPCAAIFDGDNQYDVGFSSDLQLFMGTYERNNYEKKIMEENQFRMIDYEVFLVKRVNKNDRIG